MRTVFVSPVIFAALLIPKLVCGQDLGRVVGCITDPADQPLPAATVVVSAAGTKVSASTDAQGCYEVASLAPNLYRVTARVLGLDNITHDRVRVESGQAQRLNFSMRMSTICECLPTPTTLRGLWENADAVVYLRITGNDADVTAPRGYFRQTADVLEVMKQHTGGGSATTFLQDQSSGAPEPYEVGEEFVLFLNWWSSEETFIALANHWHERNATATLFVIRNGLVLRSPPTLTRYTGGPVESLLADLRNFSNQK